MDASGDTLADFAIFSTSFWLREGMLGVEGSIVSMPWSVAPPRSAATILLLSFVRYWRMALIRNELTASFQTQLYSSSTAISVGTSSWERVGHRSGL